MKRSKYRTSSKILWFIRKT